MNLNYLACLTHKLSMGVKNKSRRLIPHQTVSLLLIELPRLEMIKEELLSWEAVGSITAEDPLRQTVCAAMDTVELMMGAIVLHA